MVIILQPFSISLISYLFPFLVDKCFCVFFAIHLRTKVSLFNISIVLLNHCVLNWSAQRKKPALCFFSAVLPLLDHSLRAVSDQINLLINNKWTNSQLGAAIFFVEFHHSKIMGLAYCDWLKRRRRRRSFSFINHTLKIKMESKLFRYHEMVRWNTNFAKKCRMKLKLK